MTARPDAPRPRWWSGWAPVATPPTVPWERPGRPGAPGAGGGPEGAGRPGLLTARELAGSALARVADAVEDGLAAMAARRDPGRAQQRRVRRAQRKLGLESAVTGGFGVVAVTAGVAPGWTVAEVAFGGAAAVVGVAAVGTARRLRELRRQPLPAPRPRDLPRPPRPPRDCPARGPLDRLAERERALAGLLTHLGTAADEPRVVAVDAAAGLRELGARTTAVDRARRGAPPASRPGLDAAVEVLLRQLEAGVAAYDSLVAAAADAVAASATLQAGDPVLLLRLTEATDSLAGLAAGLRAVAR